MSRYYWPVGPKRDRKIRKNVMKRLAERHDRNWEAMLEDKEVPVLDFPTGREELEFYRTQTDQAWWENLYRAYPDRARWRAKRWVALAARYGYLPGVMAGG